MQGAATFLSLPMVLNYYIGVCPSPYLVAVGDFFFCANWLYIYIYFFKSGEGNFLCHFNSPS